MCQKQWAHHGNEIKSRQSLPLHQCLGLLPHCHPCVFQWLLLKFVTKVGIYHQKQFTYQGNEIKARQSLPSNQSHKLQLLKILSWCENFNISLWLTSASKLNSYIQGDCLGAKFFLHNLLSVSTAQKIGHDTHLYRNLKTLPRNNGSFHPEFLEWQWLPYSRYFFLAEIFQVLNCSNYLSIHILRNTKSLPRINTDRFTSSLVPRSIWRQWLPSKYFEPWT